MLTLDALRTHVGSRAPLLFVKSEDTPEGLFAVATSLKETPTAFVLTGDEESGDSKVFARIEMVGSHYETFEGSGLKGGRRIGIFPDPDIAFAHITGVEVPLAKRLVIRAGVGAASALNTHFARWITSRWAS